MDLMDMVMDKSYVMVTVLNKCDILGFEVKWPMYNLCALVISAKSWNMSTKYFSVLQNVDTIFFHAVILSSLDWGSLIERNSYTPENVGKAQNA